MSTLQLQGGLLLSSGHDTLTSAAPPNVSKGAFCRGQPHEVCLHIQTREVAPRVPCFSEGSGKECGTGTEQLWDAQEPGSEGAGQAVGGLGGKRSKLGFLRKVELG